MEGQQILNYTIEKVLSSQSQNKCYLAIDKKTGARVLVKELYAGIRLNEIIREEVLAELEQLSKLQHPYIASLIDYVETKRGFILVLDWVEGVTLEDYIDQHGGLLEEETVVYLFCKVLEAISYAHQRNISHLNIKPSNIIITAEGQVRVQDFGVARVSSLIRSRDELMKPDTLLYMSPEQVKRVLIDRRSDIYSLGIVLFQMLAGQYPYPKDVAEHDIYRKIMNEDLPPVAEFRSLVSDKLQNAVSKATSKDASRRFQSCEPFIKYIDQSHRRRTFAKSSPGKTELAGSSSGQEPFRRMSHVLSWKRNQNLYLGILLVMVISITIFNLVESVGVTDTTAETSTHSTVKGFFETLSARDPQRLESFFEPEVDWFYQHKDFSRTKVLANYQKFWERAPEERFDILHDKLRIVRQQDGSFDVTAVVNYNVVLLKPVSIFSYDAFEYQTKDIETEAAREITFKMRLNDQQKITFIKESRNREIPGKQTELLSRKWKLVRFYDKDIASSVNSASDKVKYQIQKLTENNYLDFHKSGRYEESLVLGDLRKGTWKFYPESEKITVTLPDKKLNLKILEIGRNYLIVSRDKEGKEFISIYKPYE